MKSKICVLHLIRQTLILLVGLFCYQIVHSNTNKCVNGNLVIQNRSVLYCFGTDGINQSFIDKSTGKDYLRKNADSPIAVAQIAGNSLSATQVELSEDRMTIDFGSDAIQAIVSIQIEPNYFHFRVDYVTEGITKLDFLNIPLDLEAMPNESFAACALAMNLQTNVLQLPV